MQDTIEIEVDNGWTMLFCSWIFEAVLHVLIFVDPYD